MEKSIETIIFDFGGVLIDDPSSGRNRYLADFLKVPLEKFEEAYIKHFSDFQRCKINENEYWKLLCAELEVEKPSLPYSLWNRAFSYMKRESMFKLVSSLRDDGYKVGLLSNTEAPIASYTIDDVKDKFDSIVYSCNVGFAKPEREIYALALKRLSSKPERAVFIDDVPAYVEGARAVGMQGLHFTSEQKLLQDLSELGIKL